MDSCPIEARMLKALLHRREAIAQDLQREHNRQEKAQVACSLKRFNTLLKPVLLF